MTYFHNSVIGTCKDVGWGSKREGEGNTFAFHLKQHKRKAQGEKKLYKFPQMKNMFFIWKNQWGHFITQTTQNELMAKYTLSQGMKTR